METNLKGKVALVTGGGRDVGGDIARALAAEGAIIAVNYARSKDEAQAVVQSIEAGGGKAKAYQADISDNAQVKTMVAAIKSDFGTVDILVNNAGYVKYQRFVDSTPDEWKKQIDVCLYGAINCCHEVAPLMIAQNSGRIINLVGDSSRIGEANLALAAAARGGTIALGKSLAREFGRNNITVNTVSLGLIETSHSDPDFLEKNREKIVKAYPLRRIGKPDDVAPMVTFLASGASSWVTGQVISVNGGFAMV
ncbi:MULTISPECIES: SDR family NAD(P)-dependent oxidoreductase [Rhizobium/Agrobacterium group]|uniref:SDR family NAD(P)-dependent oxidoreductase n=1 Tax=Rhizobium/Agrobacterium group TaxID=227290 RepID=UPI00107FCDFB|nr:MULTISPECIES: SDR family oxidoreductase [Rhizobium/Agrobacterium group]MBB4403110.1 NAD(P)-dependent dehydrogenase (short-subunit alcohol dehydrogenase family) [Agrobacterium radiobacter]MBB5588980.1 NAD(P)-dependent dehydrogenase (short-subunit alcohol dehydrogenase family) [Agrobacterium radiobacter]TGE86562.1 3-oxoacyl-ACP reductase [Rhizobium sp. SEMIA 4032]